MEKYLKFKFNKYKKTHKHIKSNKTNKRSKSNKNKSKLKSNKVKSNKSKNIKGKKINSKIQKIINEKPKLIFLTGKSGVGKTYYGNILVENGYNYLELDNIVMKLGAKYNLGVPPDHKPAFKVYKNKASPELTTDFINEIHKYIKNSKKPVVIDGAISNADLIKQIFKDKYEDFKFVYLAPKNVEKFIDRIIKRFRDDLLKGSQSVSAWWDLDDPSIVKMENLDTIVRKALVPIVKDMIKKSEERYNYFIDNKFKIVKIIV